MGEKRNTTACAFDLKNPHISAQDIHEWICTQMKLDENEVKMVQINRSKRHVYISSMKKTHCKMYSI
jgi:hypothetical protein